jgi:hypothetical protein
MKKYDVLKNENVSLKNRIDKMDLFINKLKAENWNKEHPQNYKQGDKVDIVYINSAGEEEYNLTATVVAYKKASTRCPWGYYIVEYNGQTREVACSEIRQWGYAIK